MGNIVVGTEYDADGTFVIKLASGRRIRWEEKPAKDSTANVISKLDDQEEKMQATKDSIDPLATEDASSTLVEKHEPTPPFVFTLFSREEAKTKIQEDVVSAFLTSAVML